MQNEEQRRRQVAELRLLETFDTIRAGLGHDYGCGQRAGELSRRRRELGIAGGLGSTPGSTRDELVAAFEKIGRPRLRRVELDAERFEGWTPASKRTAQAWRRVERAIGPGWPAPPAAPNDDDGIRAGDRLARLQRIAGDDDLRRTADELGVELPIEGRELDDRLAQAADELGIELRPFAASAVPPATLRPATFKIGGAPAVAPLGTPPRTVYDLPIAGWALDELAELER